jgi:hypothetical protein
MLWEIPSKMDDGNRMAHTKMDQVKVSGEIGHELFQEMFPKYPMVGLSGF